MIEARNIELMNKMKKIVNENSKAQMLAVGIEEETKNVWMIEHHESPETPPKTDMLKTKIVDMMADLNFFYICTTFCNK